MIEEAVYSRLTGHAGLSALIGTRVYPQVMPQEPTFPVIVYQKISGPRSITHSGSSGMGRPRFQFAVWGPDYKALKSVVKQLVLALNGYRNSDVDAELVSAQIVNEVDFYEESTKLHRIVVDALLWHREPTA